MTKSLTQCTGTIIFDKEKEFLNRIFCSRCVLCGRTFKHYANLQIHLTGHLGVKVNIFMCTICKRKFRNQTELDLHTRSHQYAKLLGKNKVAKVESAVKAKVITTSGTADKKIIRKYLKDKVGVNSPVKENSVKIQQSPKKKAGPIVVSKKPLESLTCGLCDKSFGVKSLYLRHVKKAHPELSLTLETHSQLKALPKINVKNCSLAPSSPLSTPKVAATPEKVPTTPKSVKGKQLKTPNRQISTPGSKGKKKERTKSDSLVPDLPDYYNTLECPDCERVFIAKSIFERHLQSAKHGMYAQVNSSYEAEFLSPSTPSVPHWTESPFQTESGSPQHKIECHLCGQTFVRVKDLAKHREKMCQAYHSGKTNNV